MQTRVSHTGDRISASGLRRLFDANVIGIVVSNNAGAIIEANDAFLATIGYSREELAASEVDWRALTPDEWLPLDERAIAELRETGAFRQYEKEYVRRDGARVPVSLGGARLADTLDEQICYIVDLSAIRDAQAALRQSELRFASLADANVIGIIAARLSDRIVYEANDAFLHTLGFSRADLQAGRIGWDAIVPTDYRDADARAFEELHARGSFAPQERECVRRDGTRVSVLIGGASLEESNDAMTCYVLDLTGQREANRRLEESERRYRELAEALPDMIIVTDEQRRPVYVNRRYRDYTGIAQHEAAARWLDAIHPDDLERVRLARTTNDAYDIEYRLRRHDGAYRWHTARVVKVEEENNGTMWLGTAFDIDDRIRAEESLRFIEKAGALLSRSLDLETTFATLLDLVVPAFGDWAIVNLIDDNGRVTTRAIRHTDPAKDEIGRGLLGAFYYREGISWGTAAAMQNAKPDFARNVDVAQMRAAIEPAYFPIFEELGFGSVIALPIVSGDEVFGSFAVVRRGGNRAYAESDVPPLEELARRVGFAVANARLYEREHRVATLFQEAALPRRLPEIPGFSFDGYYRAGRREASVGGDWYDVVLLPDGRIVVSVGDVAGSGLQAAVIMGNVRQVIRGAAHVYADPMMLLDVADRTLRAEHDDRLVTAFVGVIDPRNRTMLYASAGHVPALLRTPNERVTELTAPGLPLGFRNLAMCESRMAQLPEGAHILLYTDGLIEWSHDILEGQALLQRRFEEACEFPKPHPAQSLVASVLPDGAARDDVAALIVRYLEA